MKYYGAVEAGGTKFVCSIIADPDHYYEEIRFPTTTPEETINRTIAFFLEKRRRYKPEAIGISCFGPIDLNRDSPTYGYITTTPKPNWHYADVVGPIKRALNLPVGFDTDVNGAALAEYIWGNPGKAKTLVYYTIGTGLGGGVVIEGEPIHGLVHPEAGHILLRQDLSKDPYKGFCKYHGNCFEGLCCGPAIQDRLGIPGPELGEDHPFWDVFAEYVAQACCTQIYQISPEKIVLGGGVMEQLHLFPKIHQNVLRMLNNYVQHPLILQHIEDYITPPVLGNRAGSCGAMALAAKEINRAAK